MWHVQFTFIRSILIIYNTYRNFWHKQLVYYFPVKRQKLSASASVRQFPNHSVHRIKESLDNAKSYGFVLGTIANGRKFNLIILVDSFQPEIFMILWGELALCQRRNWKTVFSSRLLHLLLVANNQYPPFNWRLLPYRPHGMRSSKLQLSRFLNYVQLCLPVYHMSKC